MKKLITMSIVAAVVFPLFADETAQSADVKKNAPVEEAERVADSPVWPVPIAIAEFPASPDVIGFRISIPFSTRQESVTGVDLGFWGRSIYFEGIQVNLLRNDVKDSFAGIQAGFYNTIGRGEMVGVQAGLWNEAGCIRGAQVGLVNITGDAEGFQVGLINRCESMYGIQVGLINVIREAEVQFLPVCNIGW